MRNPKRPQAEPRRGAAAVEFAVLSPMFLAIVLGLVEVNRLYETQNLLSIAAREGARFAALDREGLVNDGQTSNGKLVDDVKTFLEASGLPRDEVSVSVVDHESPTTMFDLDDPLNELRLFDVVVSIDYSAVSFVPVESGDDFPLTASVTFRNGPSATIAE